MTPPGVGRCRGLPAVPLVLCCFALLCAACESSPTTDPDDGSYAAPLPSATADALAQLPEGAAVGHAVVDFTGLGTLDDDLTGTCEHPSSGRTEIRAQVDTARLEILVDGQSITMTVVDGGVAVDSVVVGDAVDTRAGTVAFETPLTQDGAPVGRASVMLECSPR